VAASGCIAFAFGVDALPGDRPWLALASAGLVVACSLTAHAASPEDTFIEAENTFRFQDYRKAEGILTSLLYPEILLSSPDQVLKAHEYLAACYYWLDDDRRMEEEFIALLTLSPQYRLDPFYYPASLIDRFEAIRKRLSELYIIDLEPAPKAPVVDPPKCERTEEIRIERSWVPNLIPFGVGQFLNGQNTKGALFLTGEVLTLGTNIGAYVAIESLRGSDGLFSRDDAITARRLRIVQYVGLGTFGALAVWGIVDAFMNHEPQERSIRIVPCPAGASSGAGGHGVGLAVCMTVR
jgi:hypothetical protein